MTNCAPKQRVFKFYTYNYEGRDCQVFFFEHTAKAAWTAFHRAYPNTPVDFMFEVIDGVEHEVEAVSSQE